MTKRVSTSLYHTHISRLQLAEDLRLAESREHPENYGPLVSKLLRPLLRKTGIYISMCPDVYLGPFLLIIVYRGAFHRTLGTGTGLHGFPVIAGGRTDGREDGQTRSIGTSPTSSAQL